MKIIIEGAGEVGSYLAKMLSQESYDITVVDDNGTRLERLSGQADVVLVQGDPASVDVLKKAGAEKADLFIAVNPFVPQAVNIVSALLAKRLGTRRVTARIDDESYLTPDNRLLFKDMGIDLLFYPEKIAADEILALIKHASSTESMDFSRGKLQLSVFKLDEESPILDMRVEEFTQMVKEKAPDISFRIIAIDRGGNTLIPRHDTLLKYMDHVYFITKRDSQGVLLSILGKTNMEISSAMILGGSRLGAIVAGLLSTQFSDIKIVESDKDRCIELTENLPDNVDVIHGDGRNSDFLVEEGIKNYDAFIAVTDNDEANILSCVVAKKFGVERTIAEVENLEYLRLAEDMGVDAVINRKLITAGRILKFTLSDKVRFVKYMSGTDAEVLEYTVSPKSIITRKPLKDTDFPGNAIIGGVIRGSESFIAVGSTVIEPYDRVIVFALPEAVKEVDRLFK